MTREEYLNKAKKQETTPGNVFATREEYLDARSRCEDFEGIKMEYTEEDFRLFDCNFERLMHGLKYVPDDVDDDSEISDICNKMERMGWRWQGKDVTPDMFEQVVRYLYERCLESGYPKYSCSTGGITISTDIANHSVGFQFNLSEWAYDDSGPLD